MSSSLAPRSLWQAKSLALVALLLWLLSLTQIGFAAQGYGWRGYAILLMGWLALLTPNIAWLANLFFWLALLRVLGRNTRRAPLWLALLACVVALDTLRLDAIQGGVPAPVYGYGWGAVLWYAALGLMLAAAGLQSRELAAQARSNRAPFAANAASAIHTPASAASASWAVLLGFTLAALAPALAVWLGQSDRQLANSDERARLQTLAFKRGRVCSVQPRILHSMALAEHALQLLPPAKPGATLPEPLDRVTHLLHLGVPVLRVGERDFVWFHSGAAQDEAMLHSMPAQTPVRAALRAEQKIDGSVRLLLTERPSGQRLIDETWPGQAHSHCPDLDYRTQLVASALQLQAVEPLAQPYAPLPVAQARIVRAVAAPAAPDDPGGEDGTADAGPAPAFRPAPKPAPERMPEHTPERIPEPQAHNCPADVGFLPEADVPAPLAPLTAALRTPFAVGEARYYLSKDFRQAWCTADGVYFAMTAIQGNAFFLSMEKRAWDGFRRTWEGIVTVPDAHMAPRHRHASLEWLRESPAGLEMTLTVPEQGLRTTIVTQWPKLP